MANMRAQDAPHRGDPPVRAAPSWFVAKAGKAALAAGKKVALAATTALRFLSPTAEIRYVVLIAPLVEEVLRYIFPRATTSLIIGEEVRRNGVPSMFTGFFVHFLNYRARMRWGFFGTLLGIAWHAFWNYSVVLSQASRVRPGSFFAILLKYTRNCTRTS
jgi:hypothetical protein